MTDVRGKTVFGTFCHAPTRGEVEILDDALITIGTDGAIVSVLRPHDPIAPSVAQVTGPGGYLKLNHRCAHQCSRP